MKKKILVLIIAILLLLTIGFVVYTEFINKPSSGSSPEKPQQNPNPPTFVVTTNDTYNLNIIHQVNSSANDNYLISPYSIEIALSMLKEGANGTTKEQIEKAAPTRNINILDIKDRVSVANALFIKNTFKKDIKNSFVSKMKNEYDADLLYDEFKKPDVINNWVNEKTKKMIPKLLDTMDPDFVLGIANALAIDVEWNIQFECPSTNSQKFTKTDGTTKNVEMMHNTYYSNVEYIKNGDVDGVILPYASYDTNGNKVYDDASNTLEFIAIKPHGDVYEYINKLTEDSLNNSINSKKTLNENEQLALSLPRFEYDSGIKDFISVLQNLGIVDAFGGNANFSNISDKLSLYVGTAIHKTHISLNEKGTKAAAITYFELEKNSEPIASENVVDIKFDKPFMYIIRDKSTHEMLFFGVVENPNVWKGSTCDNK